MKRVLSISPIILGVLYAVLPVASLIGWLTGYPFTLYHYTAWAVVLAALSLSVTLLLMIPRHPVGKVSAVFCGLLLLLSAVNGACFVLGSQWKPIVIFMLVCCGCSVALMIRYTKPFSFKAIAVILSVLVAFFSFPTLVISLIFSDFSVNKVIMRSPSPQSAYTADVIDSDQGGDVSTFVDVTHNDQSVSLLIGRFAKPPVRLYTGKGKVAIHMGWKDEHTLVINDEEHTIK